MEQPLVSIIAACYNQEKFVEESLDSIKNQIYSNLEVLIFDDCSNDHSVAVIESWIKKNNFACTFVKHTQNVGVSDTLNEALCLINGKYLQFLALDDILLPQKIENQVKIFESLDESYALVYGDMAEIDEGGEIICDSVFTRNFGKDFNSPQGNLYHNIITNFFFYTQASLIRTSALKAISFKFNKDIISEDWLLQLKLAKYYQIYGNNEILTKYRIVNTSITRQNWTDAKMHLVLCSQFNMFLDIFEIEDRHSDSWYKIQGNLVWHIKELENNRLKNKELRCISWKLFIKSLLISDLILFISIALMGNMRMYNLYQKFKVKTKSLLCTKQF